MGFFDPQDGISVVSGGFSRPSTHQRHHHHHSSSTTAKDKRKRNRSRSRSRSSSSSNGRRNKSSRSFMGSMLGLDAYSGSGKRHSSDRSHNNNNNKRNKSFVGSFLGLDGGAGGSYYQKHNSSRSSFFGLPSASRSSFFGLGRSSYYKRSPRSGFLSRAYKRLKRLLRDLVRYARRHPVKVFFLVLMPLITTGALAGLLARFGMRMPAGLESMMGMASRAATGDSFGLVSDAVRMAGGLGAFGGGGGSSSSSSSNGGGASRVRVERNFSGGGGMPWDGLGSFAGGGRSSGWTDGISGMAKMFI